MGSVLPTKSASIRTAATAPTNLREILGKSDKSLNSRSIGCYIGRATELTFPPAQAPLVARTVALRRTGSPIKSVTGAKQKQERVWPGRRSLETAPPTGCKTDTGLQVTLFERNPGNTRLPARHPGRRIVPVGINGQYRMASAGVKEQVLQRRVRLNP